MGARRSDAARAARREAPRERARLSKWGATSIAAPNWSKERPHVRSAVLKRASIVRRAPSGIRPAHKGLTLTLDCASEPNRLHSSAPRGLAG